MKRVEEKKLRAAPNADIDLLSHPNPSLVQIQPTRAQFMRPNQPFQPITTRSRIDFERARF